MAQTARSRIMIGGLTACVLGGSLSACDGKISQCNRLIDVINTEQGPLKDQTSNEPAGLKKLATALDEVATKVHAVALKDERLLKFRDEYEKMAKDLAKASRDTAEAIEQKDRAKADDATKLMKGFAPRETKLVTAINGYCSGS